MGWGKGSGEGWGRLGCGLRCRVEVRLLGCGSSKVWASIACSSGTEPATWRG